MKRITLTAFLLVCGLMLICQESQITKEKNEQVWAPFIRAFGNGDDE